jgi:uncharacterized protein YkwD
MRSVLVAVMVCLILTGSATAAARRPTSAASIPHQTIKAMDHTHTPGSPNLNTRGRHGRHRAVRPSALAGRGLTLAKGAMLALINAERAQAGVGPLHIDATLNAIAQARSRDMIARHYFSHHMPGGGMVFDILDRDHVSYEMAGENIALNNYIDFYPMGRTVRQTNTDLMNSPDHRANLLEPKYTEIGLGMAFEQSSGKLIVTEVFVQR